MLSSFERDVLSLIKAGLLNVKASVSEDFDFEAAYTLACEQQIVPIVYYGASTLDGFDKLDVSQKFLNMTAKCTFHSENQLSELEEVFRRFNSEGVEHLRLKGTVLKKMYPYPEMRLMGDADIFIRLEQYELVKRIFTELGYTYLLESDHEITWKKENGMLIELHKHVMPTYNKDFHDYYKDSWDRLTRVDGSCEYKMSPSDMFVYLFAHYARHYRDGGVGIKFIVDLYVMMNKMDGLDYGYIEAELDKLSLTAFWQNTKMLIDVWFNGASGNEITDFMSARMFNSATYGRALDKLVASGAKASGDNGSASDVRKKRVRASLFPPVKTMSYMYPVLKKAPILYPFVWLHRAFCLVFLRKDKIKQRLDSNKQITDEKIDKYKAELDFVGLSFAKEE